MGSLDRVCCGGWRTRWAPSDELKRHYPPRHSDYRDSAPEPLSTVYELYQPVVQEGQWTEGLLEMWFWKHKPVKHSVHIPCWDSFKWNPFKWRGACFGRTFEECYWTGLRQTRWARAVYAANLGREYVMPVRSIGRHGYKSDIKALCWMYWLMGCVFSCGIGQLATCCGSNLLINFGAWYSCHARERLRRRYKLPPTFCMPPGIDDCLVHFFCFYCASHQELRELAVRGVDGPGMHILDVLPSSFETAPGIKEAKVDRKKVLDKMLSSPPKMFRARKKPEGTVRETMAELAARLAEEAPLEGAEGADEGSMPLEVTASQPSAAESEELGHGWLEYCPPASQEMRRATVGVVPLGGAQAAAPAGPGGGTPGFRTAPAAVTGQQLQRPSAPRVLVLREEAPWAAADDELEVTQRRWSVAY